MPMSIRRILVWCAGFGLLAIGLLALRFPVFLDDFDRWGMQIKCGSGLGSEPIQASIADEFAAHHGASSNGYTQQCEQALTIRRSWAISTAAVGWMILTWLVIPLLKPQRQQDNTISSPD